MASSVYEMLHLMLLRSRLSLADRTGRVTNQSRRIDFSQFFDVSSYLTLNRIEAMKLFHSVLEDPLVPCLSRSNFIILSNDRNYNAFFSI